MQHSRVRSRVCSCVCPSSPPHTPPILWGLTAEAPPPPHPVPASVSASNCVTYPWEELPLKKRLNTRRPREEQQRLCSLERRRHWAQFRLIFWLRDMLAHLEVVALYRSEDLSQSLVPNHAQLELLSHASTELIKGHHKKGLLTQRTSRISTLSTISRDGQSDSLLSFHALAQPLGALQDLKIKVLKKGIGKRR